MQQPLSTEQCGGKIAFGKDHFRELLEKFSKSVNEFLAFRRYDIFNKTQPIESDKLKACGGKHGF